MRNRSKQLKCTSAYAVLSFALLIAASACKSDVAGGGGHHDGNGVGGDGSNGSGDGSQGNGDGSLGDTGTTTTGCGLVTCTSAHATCGPIGDGCNSILQCGMCTPPQSCGGGGVASQCGGTQGCVPRTCATVGATCGPIGDGCGNLLNCGSCTNGQSCGGGGVPSQCGTSTSTTTGGDAGVINNCTPKTCASEHATCGPIGDGCGHVLECGTCNAPATCGGGGMASQCGGMNGCTPRTCAMAGVNCGAIGDGCGNLINCGSCTGPATCGGGGVNGQCGQMSSGGNLDASPACVPHSCAQENATCGPIGDGCGNVVQCGMCNTPDTCGGGGVPSQCGHGPQGVDAGPTCSPRTCASVGATCGPIADGCGNIIMCGTCNTPATCGGGGTANTCGVSSPPCMPRTCAQAMANCGPVGDGCGNLLQCGNCTSPAICGGGGIPSECGGGDAGVTCTNLCPRQVHCDAGVSTTVSGVVYAPTDPARFGPPDPLYNAVVYVPNSTISAFPAGVHCEQCGAPLSGLPLVTTTSDYAGRFTLTNVPTGPNVPLVIQLGRWRREVTIPNVPACTNTRLAPTMTRLPRNHTEGNIPLMAMVTGNVDALECVLEKMGIDDSEFSVPAANGGSGRVQFYIANGADVTTGAPNESQLWSSQSTLDGYDMVLLACEGYGYTGANPCSPTNARPCNIEAAMSQMNMINYANAGGRVFATHFSYVWLFNDAPWDMTGGWNINQTSPPDPLLGTIDQGTVRRMNFARWAGVVGATVAPGQIDIHVSRHDIDSVNTAGGAERWVYSTNPGTIQQYAFNTPWSAPPAQQCGRVAYSDFHVTNNNGTGGSTFPMECDTNPLTAQEKILEFQIFDLANCIQPVNPPPPPTCTPRTCAQAGANCGLIGDGCGGMLSCGTCTPPHFCGGGGPNMCGGTTCAPQTCAQQNLECGPATDGCGNPINCGMCMPPATCGGGGVNGRCGVNNNPDAGPVCMPRTCASEGLMCGQTGDGCGNTLSCGTCTPPATCGGGGQAGMCGVSGGGLDASPACTPKTCTQLGLMCGPAGDGCGNVINCGNCPMGQACGAGGVPGMCGASNCMPTTCMSQGLMCGPTGDGCGNLLDCGTCPMGQVCGGGGVNGQCGAPMNADGGSVMCTPRTCAQQGLQCGQTGDGCGMLLDCGTCVEGMMCGGAGTPGVCGVPNCTPTTCAAAGANCGPLADGCGGILDCGTCPNGQLCGGSGVPNHCAPRL
jgi:hypothetical protein